MFFAGRRDFLFGLLLLYQAPRGCGFEPVLTESGYVHRSEDVCYRVQLSLHLLSKAIVFCEDCTKLLQVEEASTMTDILLPSSVTTPTLLFLEPRVPAPSKGATSSVQPSFWTNRQKIRTPEQFSSTAKELYSTVLNATHIPKGAIMGKLEGKVAVITGGSSGIGAATAKRFVKAGAHVVIAGRQEKELKEAAAFIEINVTTVAGDVSRLEDLDRLYAVVKEKHGHIDILFANAGAGTIAPLEVATEAHFDQTFDVNVKGLFFTVQKALPLFKDGGSIILTSSVTNVLGSPGFSACAASKAAVRSFARAWTMELKDRKIRVNSMSPGPTDTGALEKTTGLTAEQAKQAAAQYATQIPMGRRGKPEELAAAVTFLASDESSFITGVDLAVDGGMAQV